MRIPVRIKSTNSICIFFLLIILFSRSATAVAQYSTLVGKVSDANFAAIPKASVQFLNSNLATSTDEMGNFSFQRIPHGTYTIRISALGYATENRTVLVNQDMEMAIQLSHVSHRLEEAVVTAQKVEGDPNNIPVSLSVVSAKDVEQQYVWNIMDVAALVPNLNMAHSGDNRNVASVRGIATTSYNQAVATYVDGVSQFSLDTYIPYLQDVERIEVLRGPQGTLYGRNAMGGVINIITRRPTNTMEGHAELHLGNHGQQRYQLGFRTPLIKDKLFFGASGLFNKLDGFHTNDFNNSNYDKQYTVFGNYFLEYLISDEWAMTLNVKHVSNRNNGAFPLVFGMANAFENPFHLSQNALTKMIDASANVSLSVNHYGRYLDFSAHTAYQSNHRYYTEPIDGDFSPIDAISIINNYGKDWNNVKVFTQELKLSSSKTNTSPLNWTGGAYLFYQHNPVRQGTYYGADAGMMGVPATDFTSILTNRSYNQGVAIFGQVGYEVISRVQVTAGLRYDYEQATQAILGEYQSGNEPIVVTQPDASATARFNAITPSANILYHIGENNMAYASYSRGFRAGGLSPLSSDPSEPPLLPFSPEFSDNIEIGTKNRFINNRLQLNLAAFFSQVNDAQVPTLIMPDAITVTQNTGRMESKGLEMEVSSRLLPNLDVWYNAAYTHARYTDLRLAGEEENVQFSGNRPVFTPEWTSSLGVQYAYFIGKHRIQVGGQWKYMGHQYFDVANTLEQKPYGLLNANLGYSLQGYELILWGQNLTDSRYVDYAYDFGAVHLGRPITYGITVRKRFGQ